MAHIYYGWTLHVQSIVGYVRLWSTDNITVFLVDILKLMFLNAALDITFNAALFVCIALTSPLFAKYGIIYNNSCVTFTISVGMITAMPVSIIVDFILHHTTAIYVVYIGMALIAAGFLGFCVSEFIHMQRESKQDTKEEEGINRVIY